MERTALILFSSRRLRINWTRKVNAVRHQNSVFHSLLKLVSWNVFDGLVEEHGADELVRARSRPATNSSRLCRSENAVRIQIAVALIALLLLHRRLKG
jgi:hypothetical protein